MSTSTRPGPHLCGNLFLRFTFWVIRWCVPNIFIFSDHHYLCGHIPPPSVMLHITKITKLLIKFSQTHWSHILHLYQKLFHLSQTGCTAALIMCHIGKAKQTFIHTITERMGSNNSVLSFCPLPLLSVSLQLPVSLLLFIPCCWLLLFWTVQRVLVLVCGRCSELIWTDWASPWLLEDWQAA